MEVCIINAFFPGGRGRGREVAFVDCPASEGMPIYTVPTVLGLQHSPQFQRLYVIRT